MNGNPLNVPPLSVAGAKTALVQQYGCRCLRHRATMLWGTRGAGKSSVVRQVAEHHGVPLVDLRLTTIEPVDIRGAIPADDVAARTVWFPPGFLPRADQPNGILFLDELTAAHQRLQISACSLILDRRVGNYVLPDGWMVVAAGSASFHGAVCHDLGTALADRMFHFNVQTAIEAFLAHALANGFAPEVMAYLKVRPDKLDDTQPQSAADHLAGASPRGWEDVSRVLQSDLPEAAQRLFVQGRIGAANAAEFYGVLREIRAGVDVVELLASRAGAEAAALLPRTLDGLYGMLYGLLAVCTDDTRLARSLEVLFELTALRGTALPLREVQTLAMELLMQRALGRGSVLALLDTPPTRATPNAAAKTPWACDVHADKLAGHPGPRARSSCG
jgi:MoxR-like ATPase